MGPAFAFGQRAQVRQGCNHHINRLQEPRPAQLLQRCTIQRLQPLFVDRVTTGQPVLGSIRQLNIKYKRPYQDDIRGWLDGLAPGDDLPAVLGTLGDVAPALIPFAVKQVLNLQYKTFSDQWATPGDTFSNTTTYGKVLSAAIGIPLEQVNAATDLLLDLNRREGPFNGVFAHRFVRPTAATLGFARFAPVTCVLELDGVISPGTLRFCERAWDALEAAGIPFTFHWGKICTINPARLQRMYGERADAWKAARRRLLSPECMAVFSNPQMEEWGLGDDGVAPAVPLQV